jgi:hypothetical protein
MRNLLPEEMERLAQQVADYICLLPDGRKLTLEDAVKAVDPEIFDRLNLLDYSLLSAVEEKVNHTHTLMDLSEHVGLVEGLPYRMDFYVRQRWLKKVKIVSHLVVFGPPPKPGSPIEQQLAIAYTGYVRFREKVAGESMDDFEKPGRNLKCTIEKDRAVRILSYLADFAASGGPDGFVTDVGTWELTARWQDGSEEKLTGSRIGNFSVRGMDLNRLIRKEIPIKKLAVFS